MKHIMMAALGTLCLGLTALGQDVTYNFDQSADFSKFKTYKWVQIEGSGPTDQLTDQQIKKAFDAALIAKGLTKTDNDNATIYVGYQFAINQEKQVSSYTTGGAGWGYGARWGGGMSTTTATTSTIPIGNLVIDMYDPFQKQLVWRCRASKPLDPKAKPDKRDKNLAKAATKMLKNFPPPVKK